MRDFVCKASTERHIQLTRVITARDQADAEAQIIAGFADAFPYQDHLVPNVSTWEIGHRLAFEAEAGPHTLTMEDGEYIYDPTSTQYLYVGPGSLTYFRFEDGEIVIESATARRAAK